MPAALPPVTDCGCSSSTSSIVPSTATCCPLVGLNNPNFDGLVPPDPTLWVAYWQLGDLINGPVEQVWYWNPTLLAWQ